PRARALLGIVLAGGDGTPGRRISVPADSGEARGDRGKPARSPGEDTRRGAGRSAPLGARDLFFAVGRGARRRRAHLSRAAVARSGNDRLAARTRRDGARASEEGG